MERWSVEKKTPEPSIQEQKETLKRVENQQREEMRRDYEYRITQKERESTEEVKSSRQHDYEVQKTYQDTVMQMKRSMDDLKRQIEQLRLSQNQWQEKAEARNVELQHVRKILDGQTRDMNKMEAALAEERRGKRKVTEELRERSREHEKQIDIDLVLISSNMECLIQQFRNICTALADKQASKKAILDTCDHLGWQLVAIADSIADGLKDKSDPTSSKPSDAGHSLSPNQDVAVAAPAVPSRPAVIPIMNTAHSPRQTAPLTSSSPTVVQSEPALAHQSTSPRAEPMISKVPTTSTSPSQSPTRHRRAKQTARKSTGTRPPLSAERSSSTTSEERLNAELELSEEERRVTPALNSIPNAFTSVLATKQRKQTARKSLGSRPSLQSGRSSSTSTFRGRNRRLSLSVSDSEEEGHGTSTLNLTPSVQGSSVSTPASERRRRTMQTARKSLGPRPPLPSERTSSTPASNRREQEAGPSEERRGTPVPNSTPSVQTPSTSTPDTEGRYPTKQTARKRVGGPPYPFFVRKSSVSKRKYKPQLYSSDLELEPPTAPVRSPASSVQGTLASDTVAQQKLIQTARKRLGGRPLLPFKRSSSVTRPPYNRVILPNAPSLRTTVGPPPSRNNPVSLSNDSEQDLRTGPRTERVAPLHPSRELVSPNGESTSGKRLLQSVDEDEELQTRPHKKQRR
ncbi:hypothetical protein L218DRAFT_375444 [Marasmius fiardii PR-910]|nr:hypothetical protein L218DRAFT_375444 [Marasmius fiardii PR-910]